MIKSMTGFGRGSAGQGQNKVEIEIRTVNSRFLEVKLRGLSIDPNIEEKVRNQISENLKRVMFRSELISVTAMMHHLYDLTGNAMKSFKTF